IALKAAVDFVVFVGAEDVANGADRIEVRRRNGAAEDKGAGPNLEQELELLLAADEAAETGEALGERTDDESIVVVAQGVDHGATALVSENAGGVGVIDVENGV